MILRKVSENTGRMVFLFGYNSAPAEHDVDERNLFLPEFLAV
jgi:hypothetical protein